MSERAAITWHEALSRLKDGNARYVAGRSEHPRADALRRAETAEQGQHPFAVAVVWTFLIAFFAPRNVWLQAISLTQLSGEALVSATQQASPLAGPLGSRDPAGCCPTGVLEHSLIRPRRSRFVHQLRRRVR